MSKLFEPLRIRGINLRNRILVSPMCQYSSSDGMANDWHLVHLGSRATGGAASVICEATAVSPEGRITLHDLGIWSEKHIPFLHRINSFISSQGALPGIQLAHAGRKASHHRPWEGSKPLKAEEGSWPTLAPSALPYRDTDPVPVEMDLAAIEKFKQDFRMAVRRSVESGFQLIEIHAAHGYLLHEFYSPLSNHRKDQYGGSFENRIRLLLEITELVRKESPDSLPVFVRISASDWVDGGWTIEESVQLARRLKDVGADLVDCSSGGNAPGQRIAVGPMYQTGFAEKIRQEAGIMTGAVGLITTAREAESIIAEGKADVVLMARQLLREPYFPIHAARELGYDITWPVQYERAK